MDRTSVAAVERQFNMGLADCGALLLGQSDVGGAQAMAEVTTMIDACREAGADEVYSTADEEEGSQFMAARRVAIPAVEKLGSVLIEDVGVPLTRVADLITGIERVAEKRGHAHRHHRACGRRQLPPARRLRSGATRRRWPGRSWPSAR